MSGPPAKKAKQIPASSFFSVDVASTKEESARRAAAYVLEELKLLIKYKGSARVCFATGASQFAFYEALLAGDADIAWGKVTCFHLDEYCEVGPLHPASFRKYLVERFFSKRTFGKMHLLAPDSKDQAGNETVCKEYAALIAEAPIDLACIGIGENGHIAFNDPPVADFDDKELVKVVELDDGCKAQQVGEGWFKTPADVPNAATWTCPAIMSAMKISVVCPDARKAKAVHDSLCGPVSTKCPASILRRHPDCRFWLDSGSASLWQGQNGK